MGQILIKHSTTAAETPATLDVGELAINAADGLLYWKDSGGTVQATTLFPVSLDSPAFINTPTAPTASPGTNTTQLSTTAFVQAAIAAVRDGVSSAYDTLAEIATALATKAAKAGDTFTGSHDFSGATVTAPRSLTVGGLAVPMLSVPNIETVTADFSTAATTDTQAWLGAEIARKFTTPGASANVYVDVAASFSVDRNSAARASGTITPQYRTKAAGVWGSWTALLRVPLSIEFYSAGGSEGHGKGVASGCASFSLGSTGTDYQFRIMVANGVSGSGPSFTLREGSTVKSREAAA